MAEVDLPKWTKRVQPEPDDIVFTYEATLNRYAVIPEGLTCCLGRRAALIRPDKNKVNQRYLFYYFFTPEWRAQIEANILSGATVDRIPLTKFPDFQVRLPALSVQEKIADVIGRYDDLIETNRRRIALLEESARLLYREWFVNLRFPGHELIKVVNGVPEGWHPTTLGELCGRFGGEIQTGPFGSQLHQHEYTDEGTPVVMPQDIRQDQISLEKISRVPDHIVSRLAKHQLMEGDILFPRRGEITKRALISKDQQGYLCGTGCLRIRVNKTEISPLWLYHHLGLAEICKWLEGKAVGATMPNLNTSILASVPVTYPTPSLIHDFSQLIEPLKEQIDLLAQHCLATVKARDQLLPKLMSGELQV